MHPSVAGHIADPQLPNNLSLTQTLSSLFAPTSLNCFNKPQKLCKDVAVQVATRNSITVRSPQRKLHAVATKTTKSKVVDLAFNDLYLIRGKKIELASGAENGPSSDKKRLKCSRVAITLCLLKCLPCNYPDEVYLIDPPIVAAACVYGEHQSGLVLATLTVVSSKFTSNWWLRPLDRRPRSLKEEEEQPQPQQQQHQHQQGELIFTVHCSSTRPKTTESDASFSSPSKLFAGPRLSRRQSSQRRKGWGPTKMPPKKPVSLTDGTDGVVSGAATCPIPGRVSPKLSTGCSHVDPVLLAKAKAVAQEAISKNMVFAVLGPYRHIREGMRRRGWVEKYYQAPATVSSERLSSPRCSKASKSQTSNDSSYRDPEVCKGDIDYVDEQQNDLLYAASSRRPLPWEEKNGFYGLLGRYVRHVVPNFIWSLKKAQIDFRFLRPGQLVNHHTKAPFTTKVGLCRNLRRQGAYSEKMVDSLFPRCFIISQDEERVQFIKEFRLTACMSALKWACNYYDIPNQPTDDVLDPNTPVRSALNRGRGEFSRQCMTTNEAILMALSVCKKHLRMLGLDTDGDDDDNDDVQEEVVDGEEEEEVECDTFMNYTNAQWAAFLTCFYATHRHQSPYSDEDEIFIRSQQLCDLMHISFPQFNLDGQRNIWIVKPGSKSRGRGITCQKKLETIILMTTGAGVTVDERFVVQKYIERPLLIYKTKFDIRQWFLVSDWQPLTIWWYRECYLRFCSREFTLDCFSEDIHLSNNAITHKYKNGDRSPLLPAENMWYLEEFRQHLENSGHRHVWELKILPGMQEAIIHAMLCSQDAIDARKGSFELYGADFMISEDDFRPWLIEINASPCMAPSTSVTSVLTAQVLEDTLKVIIDRRTRRTCDVGGFVLLYKQKLVLPNQLRAACSTRAHQSRLLKKSSGHVVPIRNLVLQPPKAGLREKSSELPSIVRTAPMKAKRPHLGPSAAYAIHAGGSCNNNSSKDYRTDEENRVPTPPEIRGFNRQAATPKTPFRRTATPARSPASTKASKPLARTRSSGGKSSLQAVLELQQLARPSALKQSPASQVARSAVLVTKLTN